MPRTNDKRFNCWADFDEKTPACRFCTVQEDGGAKGKYGSCERDPAHSRCWADWGCFAGEPRKDVFKNCVNNCRHLESGYSQMNEIGVIVPRCKKLNKRLGLLDFPYDCDFWEPAGPEAPPKIKRSCMNCNRVYDVSTPEWCEVIETGPSIGVNEFYCNQWESADAKNK